MGTSSRPVRTVAAAALAAALTTGVLAGCAGGSRAGSDHPGADVAASSENARTSVNGASSQDLASALRGADVSDPEKWAQTLVEYRPYPPGNEGMQRIRQVLDQFRADPETVSKITGVVTA